MRKNSVIVMLAIASLGLGSCSKNEVIEPVQQVEQNLPVEEFEYHVTPLEGVRSVEQFRSVKTSNVVGEDIQGYYEGQLTFVKMRGTKRDVPTTTVGVDIYKDTTNPHQFRFVIHSFKTNERMPATISTDISGLTLEDNGTFKAVNLGRQLQMEFPGLKIKQKITLLKGDFTVDSATDDARLKFTLKASGPFDGVFFKAHVKFEVTRKHKH